MLMGVGLLDAAQTLEHSYRTAGPAVHSAFDETRQCLQSSSAVFKRGRDEMIFGTVVSSDGYLLTKASELGSLDGVTVIVDRETYENPELVSEDPVWDVALVKIAARDLVPVNLLAGGEPEQGTWLVANGATTRRARRVQVGVLAANTREVRVAGGTVLGVSLYGDEERVAIESVAKGGGAEVGGAQPGDVILALDGKGVENKEELLEILAEEQVGHVVTLEVLRGDDRLELKIKLAGRSEIYGQSLSRNDAMSGDFSERRTGFPRVMQHDIIGNSRWMGGPVFDLEGRCVGMNIARFSRCETYAIPAAEMSQLIRELLPPTSAAK
ncbi:MAG: PDZ domain-containing protein [Verrucomicrobiales bacterium]